MTALTSKKNLLLTAAVLIGGIVIVAVVMATPPATRAPTSAPGAPVVSARSSSDICLVKPCSTQACDACSNHNCAPNTDGCGFIDDPADRKLCEEIYACFTDAKNACSTKGDAIRCWCGTNPTTCLTTSGPNQANGPCLNKVVAGAKSTDPETIRRRFLDPVFPLGRAANLTACRGAFCTAECGAL